MKNVIKTSLAFLFLFSIYFSSLSVHAQYRYEFTPSISVSEEYDDNLYLISDNEISDYITAVTPGIDFSILSEQTDFSLEYTPSFVFYNENTENDTTRHSASLAWGQDLTQHMRFDLSDTLYKTEEPLEYDETIQAVRGTREPYWRNGLDAGLEMVFGPQNTFRLGYGQSYLKNEDPTVDDGRIHTPSASLSYWFNTKNGMEIDYQYTKAEFWVDPPLVAGDDYTGDDVEVRYTHQFNPESSLFVDYSLATREFDGLSEDHDVHQGTFGFDHSFSPETSLSLSGGYFVQENEYSEDEDGFSYSIALTRGFERGSFTIGGAGGWDESYLDAERRGFTRYSSGNLSIEYQLSESVDFYAGGFYRRDRDNLNREWDMWRGSAEITWIFLRHFSLSLNYDYSKRDDYIDTGDYTSNRIMLSLSASKLYRW